MTLPNFILHPSRRGSQRTDVDVLGVRFPFRQEFDSPETDDAEFTRDPPMPYLVLAEVKRRWVGPNEAWRNPAESVFEDLLKAVGAFKVGETKEAAEQLRECGVYQSSYCYCSLFFICDQLDESATGFVKVPHRTWDDVLSFIHECFVRYAPLKTQTDQWGETGRRLRTLATSHHFELPEFVSSVRREANLRAD